MPPPPEAILWRYMNFPKFVAMLENGGLFFVRASKFDDPFEGSYPKKLIEAGPPKLIRSPDVARFNRHCVLVSSWHRSEYESAALWDLYGRDASGIAIVARSVELQRSFPKGILFGEIRYLDYETDQFPGRDVLLPFIHKRKSFEHEREVRAIIWQPERVMRAIIKQPEPLRAAVRLDAAHAPTDHGLWIPTGTDFIAQVKVAPNAPEWIEALTRAVALRYGLQAPVTRSDMERAPLF
jgi:hypothetical protein